MAEFTKAADRDVLERVIYFTNLPPAGSYEMEVTFVTTEGEEKSATCTLTIE